MADSNSTKHKMNMQKATNRETKLILHFKMPKKNASEKMNSTNQPASLPASQPVCPPDNHVSSKAFEWTTIVIPLLLSSLFIVVNVAMYAIFLLLCSCCSYCHPGRVVMMTTLNEFRCQIHICTNSFQWQQQQQQKWHTTNKKNCLNFYSFSYNNQWKQTQKPKKHGKWPATMKIITMEELWPL